MQDKASLITKLMDLNREAMRLPSHHVDKRADLHARMNDVLTLLELVDD